MHYKTTFSPLYGRFFLVSKSFFFGYCMDVPYWEAQASWAWPAGFHPGQLSIEFVNVGVVG